MSDTVFTKVDYDLGTLVKYTELGELGLPDIQRPFVWKNAKVRDLFDSIYRGYDNSVLNFRRVTTTIVSHETTGEARSATIIAPEPGSIQAPIQVTMPV